MEFVDRVDIFKEQLDLIFDSRIKEFTKLCLLNTPDYIFVDCPASSSGKHHPINELGWDGVIVHTKKVFNVAYVLTRGLGIEHNRDVVLSACLIHDLLKKGLSDTGHTRKDHPELAANLVKQVQADTQLLTSEEYNIIYNSVLFHYGPWTERHLLKPISEYSLNELCVFLSDYIASKRFIDVKYNGVEHE